MGVRTAVQPQQLGQIGGSVEIAADALADEVALTAERDDVRLAEGLVLVGLAEQSLVTIAIISHKMDENIYFMDSL